MHGGSLGWQHEFLLWPAAMLLVALAGQGSLPFLRAVARSSPPGRSSLPALAGLAAYLWLCLAGAIERAHDMSEINGVAYSGLAVGIIVTLQFAFFALLNTR